MTDGTEPYAHAARSVKARIDMSIVKKDFKALSSDGIHTLSGAVYAPDQGEVMGFFHVVHGMTEHIARYERFMSDMAEAGWICFGYDNLGHGRTAENDAELGYIAKTDGWDILAKDVKAFSDAVFAEYGVSADGVSGRAPYVLMGHSMGSFIARLAAQKYVRADRLVIMGTGGKNGAANAGLAVIALIKLFFGDKHISPFVDKLAFGSYNSRFTAELGAAPSPWLTNDIDVRKRYSEDKYCSFKFTVSAMGDLIRLTKYSNSTQWYKSLPREMPVLLVSGEEDPVGNYGKGVCEVRDGLAEQGIDVKCILYKGARHEILNDFTYDRVKEDILDFCGGRE